MRLGIPKPPYSEKVENSLAKWLGNSPLEMPEIFEAFHVHPELASRAGVLGAGFLGHCLMSRRDREIIVHRVTGRCGAEHEWGLHATSLAGTVGLSEVQVDDTVAPSLTPGYWTEDEIHLMAVVDELADSTDVCDASWEFLKHRYNEQQLIEFILLVGWYRTVSSMCKVLRIPPHPQCRRFPE